MHDACISNTHSSLHRVPPSCPSIASTPHAHLQTWQQLQAVRTQLATKKQQLATFQQHQASSIAAGLHVVSMPPVHPVWCILPLYVTSHLDTFRLVGGWVGGWVCEGSPGLPSFGFPVPCAAPNPTCVLQNDVYKQEEATIHAQQLAQQKTHTQQQTSQAGHPSWHAPPPYPVELCQSKSRCRISSCAPCNMIVPCKM